MPKKIAPRVEKPAKTADEALASLMRLSARSEKSSGDALRLMRGWGVTDAQAREVLHKLIESRFIDDSRYAAAYVREKSRLNGWGSHKIRMMLRTKGIDKEIIDNELGRLDRVETTSKLGAMLAKKAWSIRAASDYELRGKLFRYGMSLGYDYDEVAAHIDRIVGER